MNKAKKTPKNIMAYITGKLRYKLYYSKGWTWLLRVHIKEQIDFRIKIMEQECYNTGSCIKCGCQTTALQMANKACDKPCYPPMFSGVQWVKFAGGDTIKGWSAKTDTRYTSQVEAGISRKYVEKIYYIYKENELVHSKRIKELYGMENKTN